MPLSRLYTYFFLTFFFFYSLNSLALDVTFINPGFSQAASEENKTGNFWFKVSTVMHNAATDLDINLNIKYANRNHILMKELIRDAIKNDPDYLILVDEKSVASEFLTKLNTKNVPIYFLLNRPSKEQLAYLRRDGLNIIGSVIPDNYNAGKELAHKLFNKHILASNQPANILALMGDYTTPASIDRTSGLNAFVAQKKNIKLTGKDVANWSEQESYKKTLAFMQLAPEINIIWCANDAIAFGAKRALTKLNKENDVLIGGINWDSPPHGAQPLDVTLGGHVLLGAYALTSIFDHHANIQSHVRGHIKLPIFSHLTNINKPLFTLINQAGLAVVDFRKFSKTSPDWQSFTVDNILKQL